MANEEGPNRDQDGMKPMAKPGIDKANFKKLAMDVKSLGATYGPLLVFGFFLVASTWGVAQWVSSEDRKNLKSQTENAKKVLTLERRELELTRRQLEASRKVAEQAKRNAEERGQTTDLLRWTELSGPPRVNKILSTLILGYRWRWEVIEPYSNGWTTATTRERIEELDAKIRVLMEEAKSRGQLDPKWLESPYESAHDREVSRRIWDDWESINTSLKTAMRHEDVDGIRDALGRWRENNNEFFVLASRRISEVILSDFSLPHGNENLWPPDLRIVLGSFRLAVAIQFEVLEPYFDHSLLDFGQRATRLENELVRVLQETERSGFVNKVRTLSAFEEGELRDRIARTFDESERFMPALRAALAGKDQKLIEVGLKKWRITNYNYMSAAAERCAELISHVAPSPRQDE